MQSYQHRVFLEKVAGPAREALDGVQLYEWIENSANRLLLAHGRDNGSFEHWYPKAFKLNEVSTIPYNSESSWTASIRLSSGGHELSVLRVSRRDRMALIAHELGHALLFEHQALWKKVAKPKLIVDPLQERLVDDIARSLLFPKTMFDDEIAHRIACRGISEGFELALAETKAPARLVLARLMQMTLSSEAALIYLTIPLQRELFRPREVKPVQLPQTKCVIRFTPLRDHYSAYYPFIDFIQVSKSLNLDQVEEGWSFGELENDISRDRIASLLRKSDHHLVRYFKKFSVIGSAPLEDIRHIAILCTR